MATTSTPTTPRTLLEAVNTLLLAVRLGAVMSLNAADLNEDAAGAKSALDDASREVQLRGYEFNTDWDYKIDPNVTTGEITLPENTLKVRAARCSNKRLVQRGLRLYDSRLHTYSIGKTVSVDIVVALPFEDLPEGFKLYVTASAARKWCLPKLPASATFEYTKEMLANALSAAEEQDAEMADATAPDTSPHFAAMRRRS
jgi:hypothetical protein